MDRDQITELLQIVQAYDSRNIDRMMIAAWTEAARRGNWRRETATEAVHEFFASETGWLMPGHVTQRAKAIARQPRPASEVLGELEAAPASAESRAKVLRMVRDLAEKKSVEGA